jgi:hypothetical protein
MRFKLQKVRYIPVELQADILYVSKEFGIAVHLCACGCGSKIRTPLGPTEWSVRETRKGLTLNPSVGNWQETCRSHYWILEGKIRWADRWSSEQISAGRQDEERRRAAYYAGRGLSAKEIPQRFWRRVKSLFPLLRTFFVGLISCGRARAKKVRD